MRYEVIIKRNDGTLVKNSKGHTLAEAMAVASHYLTRGEFRVEILEIRLQKAAEKV